jgi:sugar/nucleoside kinase (ribokinase family)
MKYDVLALGDYYLDLIFTGLGGEPELGKEVFSKDFSMLPGGTYNAVAALHKLGVKVAWAVDFGNDDFSKFVFNYTMKDGLDPVCYSNKSVPLRNITVSSSYRGDRQFISFSDPRHFGPDYIKRVLETECRILFISGLYQGRLLKLARRHFGKRDTLIAMDGNSSKGTLDDKKIMNSLKQVDIFMPNGCEARRLTGVNDIGACMQILGEYTSLVVIKDGPNGAYANKNGEFVHVPCIPVKCIDTTGAGDCFDAGFLKAYLDGKDLVDCLRWGNIVGGLSTQTLGGSGSNITVAEVKKLEDKYYR